MELTDFVFALQCGEEIEICLENKLYFLQPEYETLNRNYDKNTPPYPNTIIFDVTESDTKEIFRGCTEDVLDYKFNGTHTLRSNLTDFRILW